jgi:2,5-diketo-D-gluconate reductase A
MMNKANNMNRRNFLRNSAGLASALLVPFSANSLYAALAQNAPKTPAVKLNNGLPMPLLGFGTNTLNGELGARCVADAISVGYRLIDTANIYGNEAAVGEGIKQSGIGREELFITSKLWVDDYGYETTKNAFQASLDKLGTNYLDLYLLHRPRGDYKASWKALEELYKGGKIKAIGISNFNADQLADLMTAATIHPAINQIETHAFFHEQEAYTQLKTAGIQHQAWSPFAAGRSGIFENKTLSSIGHKHGKSIAQVCLRWHYQRGIVAIPRSSQKAHMIENLNIFDFQLDEADFKKIGDLDLNKTQFPEWS